MKRNSFFLLMAVLPAMAMQAQTSYEAAALLDTDLSGTARYVGMGGAMSALGADMSTMSTNPAGTALYRSWDAAFSFGGNGVEQRTESNSNRGRSFKAYGSFDNAGVVIANKISNTDALRFVNFGFNYRNVKRYNGKMGMASNLGGYFSQTGQMAWQAFENLDVYYEDFDPNDDLGFFRTNYYKDSWVGWLTLMGAQGYLIDKTALGGQIGDVVYPDGNYYPSYSNNYSEVLSGGTDAYDFNLSFNVFDAVYLGATFTWYTIDRKLESVYSEEFHGGNYTLENFYRTTGDGFDLKLGVILRPFSEYSFRVGVSATTPTRYTLRDYNSAILNSTVSFVDNSTGEEWKESFRIDTYDKDAFGGDCYTDYTMVAPAKVNVSLGGTIGTSLALGAEYEYMNYGATKLYYNGGMENTDMNTHTGENFNGMHTLRLGAEKTFGSFYTRLGYNLQTGGYKSDAWKMIPINSVQTNTAYANIKSTQNFTCGVGFHGDTFYVDAALLYSLQKSDFYPFENIDLQATSVSRNLFKGMMTLGVRF